MPRTYTGPLDQVLVVHPVTGEYVTVRHGESTTAFDDLEPPVFDDKTGEHVGGHDLGPDWSPPPAPPRKPLTAPASPAPTPGGDL